MILRAMRVLSYFDRKSKPFLLVLACALILLIGAVDYFLGTLTAGQFGFSIFYLLPIFLVSWFCDRTAGTIISVLSAVVWFSSDVLAGHVYVNPFIPYWNAAVRLGFFLLFSVLLAGLRTSYEERKRLAAELEVRAKELARSNEELERFASVAAHDLKAPLTVAEGYLGRLQRKHGEKLDSEAREHIDTVMKKTSSMRFLITDLLAYARVGMGARTPRMMDLNDVVHRALGNLQSAAEEASAVVQCDPLPSLMGDDVQMVELFQNLIGNAIKFRGVEPPLIRVSAERRGDVWVFSVHDNGIGISAEDAGGIFDMFRRLHGASKYEGTGIGLTICKKVVENHGGTIWVESTPGRSSTFRFTLPASG